MSISQSLLDEVIAWRRELHQYPELGFAEVKTSQRIAGLLESFGLRVDVGMAQTGVIGTLSNGDGPTIGLRADIDALPFTELGQTEHKSCHQGVMHACGHDGHTAMLLGAAKYLSETRQFKGTVHFIFQPAEELLGGAKRMADEGLFRDYPMSAVFGLHNWPALPAGHVAVNPGAMMASLDTFKITLTGKSGHAAMPEQGLDPIVCGSELVSALQTITSRRLSPLDSAVVSVTQFHGGEATNVIPETVELQGTFRCLDKQVRSKVKALIDDIANGVCRTHGLDCVCEFFDGYSVTENHPQQASQLYDVACSALGADQVHWNIAPSMASEDFSCMLEHCPGAYFWLGAGESSRPLHNAYYDFNDTIVESGIRVWKTLIETLLK